VIGGEDPIDRLKLSRAEGKQLSQILAGAAAKSGPAELAYRFGEKLALDILLVRSAMARQPLPNGYEEAMVKGASAKFPVKPADLSGIAGPALGNQLKKLEDSWIASGFELSREQLLS
jgi:poly(A) polymerase